MKSAVYKAVSPWHSGRGSILMFHRVCQEQDKSAIKFNSVLEVTAQYLERIILYFLKNDYRFAAIDEVPEVLVSNSKGAQKIVVFTFDDGYADNHLLAYPLLKKYEVPFAIYITTSFPEHTAVLWWYMLDDLVSKNDRICFGYEGQRFELDCSTPHLKEGVFLKIRQLIISCGEGKLSSLLQAVFEEYGIRPDLKIREMALSWEQIAELAQDPLVTIGAHTLNHVALSKLGVKELMHEIVESRRLIESKIKKPVRHFSYPFGGKNEAGPREFNAVRQCGFETGTTSRTGNLFSGHRFHLEALPRLLVDGNIEDARDLEVFVSGFMPFVHNRLRRLVFDSPSIVGKIKY